MTDDTQHEDETTSVRSELTLLGRLIGTYAGTDPLQNGDVRFYNFQVNPDHGSLVEVLDFEPTTHLDFNLESGVLEILNDDGDILYTADAVTLLAPISKE